MFEKKLVSIY